MAHEIFYTGFNYFTRRINLKIMWQSFKRFILAGLIAILPFAATIWILQIIFYFLEGLSSPILRKFEVEIPGMGLILTLAMIFLLGVFITNVVGRRLYNWGERILHNIPMVSTIYSTLKQFTSAFSGERVSSFRKVIFMQYPREGLYTMCFVTNETINEGGEVYYHVFVPTTPNPTSGVFIIIPKKDAIHTSLKIEEGLKAIISGGILDPGEKSISSYLPGKDKT